MTASMISSVPPEEDAFYKMETNYLGIEKVASKMGIIHSRYASQKEFIKTSLAHPLFDDKNRIALYHNGFIANYEDLQKQLKQERGIEAETDSQVIAKLIGVELDTGASIK